MRKRASRLPVDFSLTIITRVLCDWISIGLGEVNSSPLQWDRWCLRVYPSVSLGSTSAECPAFCYKYAKCSLGCILQSEICLSFPFREVPEHGYVWQTDKAEGQIWGSLSLSKRFHAVGCVWLRTGSLSSFNSFCLIFLLAEFQSALSREACNDLFF